MSSHEQSLTTQLADLTRRKRAAIRRFAAETAGGMNANLATHDRLRADVNRLRDQEAETAAELDAYRDELAGEAVRDVA